MKTIGGVNSQLIELYWIFNKWVEADNASLGYYSLRLYNDGSGKLISTENVDVFMWATFDSGIQKFERLLFEKGGE